MKELTSQHDDMDKRLAIFFGLGAFLMSSMIGLIRGYSLEGFLLQGIVVLTLAVLGGYAFGTWLRAAIKASTPAEELPEGTERRTHNKETLEEGSLVIPNQTMEAVIAEEPGAPLGQAVNYSFPELTPGAAEPVMAAAPMAPAAAGAAEEDGDLPPPPVPGWLK
jgi:hypothetical protein